MHPRRVISANVAYAFWLTFTIMMDGIWQLMMVISCWCCGCRLPTLRLMIGRLLVCIRDKCLLALRVFIPNSMPPNEHYDFTIALLLHRWQQINELENNKYYFSFFFDVKTNHTHSLLWIRYEKGDGNGKVQQIIWFMWTTTAIRCYSVGLWIHSNKRLNKQHFGAFDFWQLYRRQPLNPWMNETFHFALESSEWSCFSFAFCLFGLLCWNFIGFWLKRFKFPFSRRNYYSIHSLHRNENLQTIFYTFDTLRLLGKREYWNSFWSARFEYYRLLLTTWCFQNKSHTPFYFRLTCSTLYVRARLCAVQSNFSYW